MAYEKNINFGVGTANDSFPFTAGKNGATAYSQFLAKQTIHAKSEAEGLTKEVYIPFHAVKYAVASFNGQEVGVTDDLCGGDAKKPYCESDTYMLIDAWGNDYWNADTDDSPISISIDVPHTLRLCTTDDAIDEYSVVSTNPSAITVTDNGISEGHRWVTITPIAEGRAIIEFDIPGNDCLVAFCYAVE